MLLKDRVCIVTGAAQGLGKAYAKGFLENGAKAVIVDVNQQALDETCQELSSLGDVLAVKADVTSEEETARMADQTQGHFGKIDVLVNNAAVFSTLTVGPWMDLSLEEWDRVCAVQLRGMFLCCRAVYPAMKRQGKGKIINVSSATAINGKTGYLHYVTSKAGVIGFTRALAREIGKDGITVNTLSPGSVRTEKHREAADSEHWRRNLEMRSLKRDSRPEDIVRVAIFLASDLSDWMTGQLINVDGGKTLY